MIRNDYAVWENDSRRSESPEMDFGVHWQLNPTSSCPLWWVSWIETTGELYAVEIHTFPERRFLSLGSFPSLEEVRYSLAKWSDPAISVYGNLEALGRYLRQKGKEK